MMLLTTRRLRTPVRIVYRASLRDTCPHTHTHTRSFIRQLSDATQHKVIDTKINTKVNVNNNACIDLPTYHPVTFLRRPRFCLPEGTIISCTRTAAILLSVPRSLVNALSTRGIFYQLMLISAHVLVSFVRTVRLVDLSGCLRCFGSQLAV